MRLSYGRARRIIPAYAGSTCRSRALPGSLADHPRIRGEHLPCPLADWATVGSSPHTRGARRRSPARRIQSPGSSPHTRGALRMHRRHRARGGIIPAYAGSTSCAPKPTAKSRDHPRIRGEHAGFVVKLTIAGRIIPAYAGSTTVSCGTRSTRRDHPRIRGEHRQLTETSSPYFGSSPHTRGALVVFSLDPHFRRIIPAYAGSTVEPSEMLTAQKDHPRIRGEHFTIEWEVKPGRGSSPHTRGALAVAVDLVQGLVDHPRIRGEHVPKAIFSPKDRGSSPHTRGARGGDRLAAAGAGIIPAYAGSTMS